MFIFARNASNFNIPSGFAQYVNYFLSVDYKTDKNVYVLSYFDLG